MIELYIYLIDKIPLFIGLFTVLGICALCCVIGLVIDHGEIDERRCFKGYSIKKPFIIGLVAFFIASLVPSQQAATLMIVVHELKQIQISTQLEGRLERLIDKYIGESSHEQTN